MMTSIESATVRILRPLAEVVAGLTNKLCCRYDFSKDQHPDLIRRGVMVAAFKGFFYGLALDDLEAIMPPLADKVDAMEYFEYLAVQNLKIYTGEDIPIYLKPSEFMGQREGVVQ